MAVCLDEKVADPFGGHRSREKNPILQGQGCGHLPGEFKKGFGPEWR